MGEGGWVRVDGAGPKVRSYSKRKPEYLLTFGPALSACSSRGDGLDIWR
jgi:hypothetical protein